MIVDSKIKKKQWDIFFKGENSHYFIPFKKCCAIFKIKQEIAFLAQLCHESNFFKSKIENLNYSKGAIERVFGYEYKGKNINLIDKHVRNPQALANWVYRNQGGNGDEHSGEGWKYRGRTWIMTTLKNNYKILQKHLFYGLKVKGVKVDCVENPDIILEKNLIFWPSGFYWKTNSCGEAANFKELTRIINGGYNGFEHRREIYRNLRMICK